jgi:hypothetical protein
MVSLCLAPCTSRRLCHDFPPHQHFSVAIPRATRSPQHAAIVCLLAGSNTSVPPGVADTAVAASVTGGEVVEPAVVPGAVAAVVPGAVAAVAPAELPSGVAAPDTVAGAAIGGVRGVVEPHTDVGLGGDVLRTPTGKPVALHEQRLLAMPYHALFPWSHGLVLCGCRPRVA